MSVTDAKTAFIYYLPPLATRFKQIGKAQQLLEVRGYKVKVVEARQLSSGDRRALEQGGHSYPAIHLNGSFINIDQLEATLEEPASSPSTTGAIGARKAPPIPNDFFFGVSPPGPQSIWVAPSSSPIDPPSPRRFGNVDQPQEDSHSEEEEELKRPQPSFGYDIHPGVEPSPFDHPFGDGLALEEIGIGDHQEIHGSPLAAPSRPPNYQPKGISAPVSFSEPIIPISDSLHPAAASSSAPVDLSISLPAAGGHPIPVIQAPSLDPRTERLIWLFNGIKQYCESAEFKRAVNLLGKTADMVESQARSLWSLFGWGTSSNSSSSPSSSSAASNSPPNTSITHPPDTETTLTLLVVRTNWYGRDQYRFLRLDSSGFVRLRTDNLEECERTPYENLIAAQVSGSTIKFRYTQGGATTEIAYNFGDAEVARMIADALQFLKGKGSVAVSYVGN